MGDDHLDNMDEAPVFLDMPHEFSVNTKGAHHINVRTTGHQKSRVSVVLCCSASGRKAKPLVILKRKSNKLPRLPVGGRWPAGVEVACHNKGWRDVGGMRSWFNHCYLPY